MNKAAASLVIICILLASVATASAQRVTPPVPPAPPASQILQAPYQPSNPNAGPEQSRPLLSIGQVPVVIWAPVEPTYSLKMNRTQAANALMWDADNN